MKRFYPVVIAVLVLTSLSLGQNSKPLVVEQPDAKTTAGASTQPSAAPKSQEKEAYDPILDIPPLPKGPTSLVGGTVDKIDGVRNRVVVRVFGGGKMATWFDDRTHFYRDGVETTMMGIRKGDRVYVDTMSDSPRVLARNIRVVTSAEAADARGKVLTLDARDASMVLLDSLSGQPVSFSLDSDTRVLRNGQAVALQELQPGAIIAVKFSPDRPHRGLAREITVLALPGSRFTFLGRVTNLDLRLGQVSVANLSDQKTYDINFDPNSGIGRNLTVGTSVLISAVFDGNTYHINSVRVQPAPAQ